MSKEVKRTVFAVLAWFVVMGLIAFASGGCSVVRKLEKKSASVAIKSDSTSDTKTKTAAATKAKVDSAGKANTASRATETATNETTEETTTTEYDPTSGKVAKVTQTRRRATGTAAKSSETKSSSEAATSRAIETKTETKAVANVQVQKEEKRKTLDKHTDMKSKPVLGTWALIAGGLFVVVSLAMKFIPAVAVRTGGGPIGLFFAWLRRKKKQETA